ncbi:Retrovirus-related Pol polyprotein from transposon TNT 1-94 [Scomber scombrus]|uniref:Retrovirus-related Pol polyprotein from transposon TNT 1-94 n=1 Tax=Scomber scombrus TaxID=13677 RepID=A0AAV1PQW2_SCOSC
MDNLTLQFVQQALINEEQKRVQADDNGAATGGASAMSTQVRGDMQPNSKAVGADRSSSWRCYKCGQEGLIKRDCPRGKKKKKIHKAKSMMCEDTEESSESAFVVKATNQNEMSQQSQWLIDSGASKHMTCYKECLQDYQQFSEPQSVKLGDGRVVDALGLGNINLRMTFKVSDVKNVTMYDVIKLKELKNLVNGVDFTAEKEATFCEACVEGKLSRKPHKPVGEIRSKRKLQLIHSDVCGPMQTESIGGVKYFVTFIDDYSRCCKVYFLKQKSEVLSKFNEFEKTFSNECGQKVTRLRTDNGGKYTSSECQEYLKAQGIHNEMTVPHTPQQNGVAERKNRTLIEAAKSMLSHAKLPKMYWAEALATAAYIQNRLPTSVLNKSDTLPEMEWQKAGHESHESIWLCCLCTCPSDEATVSESARESSRIRKPPKRYGYDEFADKVTDHIANVCCVTEPSTLKEALMSPNAKEWQEAADSEYESLLENETWDLLDLPKDRKAIGSRSRQELEILAVYVDDLILITESTESMDELKQALKRRYKMKDMGELSYILGISVIQDRAKKCVFLRQKHYIETILQKYGMNNANPIATPADANVKLRKDDGVSKPVNPSSLLYAAMATRPDIAQAVSVVSKFNANPNTAHLTAVKIILRYLKGTVNLALKYEQSESGTLIGFSDADWAGDQDDCRSTTGDMFFLSGGASIFRSKILLLDFENII